MATDTLSTSGPAAGRTAGGATSDATRLLCAGTYLDPVYRATVIRELLTHRFRVVAPSYGYDAVPVLAHALAARRLRRARLAVLGAGAALTILLMSVGVLYWAAGLLTLLWLLWVTAYLRRVVTLQTLVNRLRRGTEEPLGTGGTGGFTGAYPRHPLLTPELVAKIDREQASDGTLIHYGGYKPFVGAGVPVRRWSTAELLTGAPLSVFEQRQPPPAGTAKEPGRAVRGTGRKEVVPFTVEEITAHVTARLAAELRDEVRQSERIDGLAVERSTFTTAVTTRPGRREGNPAGNDNHWDEVYDSARTYLCVRVGSWNQELVTTAFVGFDLKGNTLHTEFYSYVLAPIRAGFHLVDRLPATLDAPLLLRVAWDTLRGAPAAVLRPVVDQLLIQSSKLSPRHWKQTLVWVLRGGDSSEFRLGRYADGVLDRGALTSIRELATSDEFHHFFQETDTIKYTQIVERKLLHVILDYLHEHNVDLTEHEARQTNILNQDFGRGNTFGSHSNFGPGKQDNRNSGTQRFSQRASRPARQTPRSSPRPTGGQGV
ncbi:hypothetical protein [Streptomyces sp. NPDC096132]|uniref:hypothetical protein n=1 Tax=Streptomyces sp. NPDC096132 TaxID=3366075 RepID=UPI0037FD521F